MTTTVSLIGGPIHPLLTIHMLWTASRSTDKFDYDTMLGAYENDEIWRQTVDDQAIEILLDDIPVAENLDFVFLLENVPVSLREQMVRSRIGHSFGENFGVDILPFPQGSGPSFWSQTMRILNMGTFAAEGNYFIPTDVVLKGAASEYKDLMEAIEVVYNNLLASGIAPEDARQVLPLATCSRISWKVNFQALKGLLRKRGCWIAQLGMWKPVIEGMVEELSLRIHPAFRRLITPPCLHQKKHEFTGCPYRHDAGQRMTAADPEPPCPLYVCHELCDGNAMEAHATMLRLPADKLRKYNDLAMAYRKLWNRDTFTGVFFDGDHQ